MMSTERCKDRIAQESQQASTENTKDCNRLLWVETS